MLIPAILLLLLNTTGLWPPLTQSPITMAAPFTGGEPLSLPPLPGSLVGTGGLGEGAFGSNGTLYSRGVQPGTASADPFGLVQSTWSASSTSWISSTFAASDTTFGSPLEAISDFTGNTWIVTAAGSGGSPASGGGTAGNGGGGSLFVLYPAPDPAGGGQVPPAPLVVYNATEASAATNSSVTILDLQMTSSGLYALCRIVPRPGGPGLALVQSGVAAWGLDGLPRRPFLEFPWMLGTVVPRQLNAFAPPPLGNAGLLLWNAAYPPTLELWAKNITGAKNWFVERSLSLRLPGSQPIVQLLPAVGGSLTVVTRKSVSLAQLSTIPPTETMLAQLPAGSPLYVQSATFGQIDVTPTPTARPTESMSVSRSASVSRSSTATASATASESSTSSGTASATITASATATGSSMATQPPTVTPRPSYSFGAPIPTESGSASRSGTASASPQGLRASYTATATASASASATSSNNSTGPVPPPAAAAQGSLTEPEKLGLGFGLTAAALVVGGGLAALFARQALFQAAHWFKQKFSKKVVGPKSRHVNVPRRPGPLRTSTVDPSVIQLSINPAVVAQQTSADLLHQARLQRLEAMTAQRAEVLHERPTSFRMNQSFKNSFKMTYAPTKLGGGGGTGV